MLLFGKRNNDGWQNIQREAHGQILQTEPSSGGYHVDLFLGNLPREST